MTRKKRKTLGKIPAPSPFVKGLVIVLVVFSGIYILSPLIRQWQVKNGPVFFPVGRVRGIDVSHFQEEIDWEQVARCKLNGSPVSFVFIKASEGKTILDEYFVYNFTSARQHGLIRGAYHVFSSKSSPQEQAKFFCKIVDLKEKDLYPVLDVEQLGLYTPRQMREAVLDWMNIVERHFGVTPILYTSSSFKTKYLSGPEFDRYPYWIAHYYVKQLSYKGDWKFWQHTDVGELDGIKGYVDINVFNGTYFDLLALTISKEQAKKMWNKYNSF